MESGFSQSVNINKDKPTIVSTSTPVMINQTFKKKNPVFEKHDEVTLTHMKKSIIEELSNQYLLKSIFLQNKKHIISAFKNLIVCFENEILFPEKGTETKKQLISTIISMQLLTQKQSLWKS